MELVAWDLGLALEDPVQILTQAEISWMRLGLLLSLILPYLAGLL